MRNPGPLPDPQTYYDVRWADGLTRALRTFFDQLRGDWQVEGRLIGLGGRALKVTSVTDATYTIKRTDDVVDVDRAGTVTATLPENPIRGERHIVQDGGGNAGSNTITIEPGSGLNLNGGTGGVTITTNFGRKTVIYNGTQWVAA